MPEPKTGEEGKESKGNLPDEVTKVLEDIKAQLGKTVDEKPETPAAKTPTYADTRADLQKRLGFTDEQMSAHEEMILKAQAPIIENAGWQKLDKKSDIETYRKELQDELAIYPPERRTPEIMEKLYFMLKGRRAESKPADKPAANSGEPKTRISGGPGYNGSDPSLGGREGATEDEDDKLSETETFVARKLGVPEKEYARAKRVGREAWKLKPQDVRESRSTADMELKRLMTR